MNQNNLTGTGQLQINSFNKSVGRPAPNATVRVISKGTNDVIEEFVTDESGNSPVIELPAPNVEFSLNPPQEVQPYSEYDVSVTLEGFEPLLVEGVQVLPNSIALQSAVLLPALEQSEEIFIDVLPHTLWGEFPAKAVESEVKPLPDPGGFVVLPEPVIPEFIIVHEGNPNDSSAPNRYISFKSYIKNVTSCEIYSTWPEECIKANVLAIISFTLNRVYTEWYRSMGFNFTITNSTYYDQAFVFGRNIFKNISNIVDDLFTTYITKPEIRQPLFTQYCDGVRHECAVGLKQWGSKQLAEQGFSAIRILRYYYGQNIFLTSAESVEGVPASFPGIPLRIGSTGESVRMIQEQLNSISNNYPAISKVRVDGVYGAQTAQSVRQFQDIFNIPNTGIVDFPTWYQISRIFTAVEGLAEPAY